MIESAFRASLRVDADHPCLAGHFPGRPIVPGVLILDEVLAVVLARHGGARRLLRLPQVKFLQPLLPDEAAIIACELEAAPADALRVRFRVLRDEQLLVSGELLLGTASR